MESTQSGMGQLAEVGLQAERAERSSPSAAGRRRLGDRQPRRSAFWVEPELHRLVAEMARRNGRTIMGQITVIVEEAMRREAEQSRRASDRKTRPGAQRHERSAAERSARSEAGVA